MIDAQSYEELGRKLRHARHDTGVELLSAARELHIRPRYLEALENGTLEDLPGDAYVKGYFRQYARFLGLVPDEVVEAYQRIGALPQRRLLHIPESISKEQHPGAHLTTLTLALAVAIGFLWVYTAASSRPRVSPVLAPPPPPAAQIALRYKECFSKTPQPFWPPCYHEKGAIFEIFVPRHPLNTLMELKP